MTIEPTVPLPTATRLVAIPVATADDRLGPAGGEGGGTQSRRILVSRVEGTTCAKRVSTNPNETHFFFTPDRSILKEDVKMA
jgi:hypothetical protein